MKISKKILPNGLRVVTIPMKDNPTVTALVLVEAGSKYEDKRVNGISHFLEHMCFKGTESRPKAMTILKELDALGCSYNAFTSQEYTGYYAKADAKHFKKIFDVVSDIYLHSTMPEEEILKERGVVIEEINMYKDMPHRHVQDLFTYLLYGDQPAGRSILGTKENILSMNRKDFLEYKKAHYLPQATVIAVAGKITEKEVLREANKIFGGMKKGKKSAKPKVIEGQKKPAILLEYKKTDQAHFVLGFRSFSMFDKRSPALSVLSSVFAGGMSSRLYERLREEMGVGYYMNAYNDTSTDHGVFQISAGVDKTRIKEVIEVVLRECKKIKEEGISSEELARAKEMLVGGLKFGLESTDDIANFYGGQELLKRKIYTADERITRIRKVTQKEVQQAAADVFQGKTLSMAMIGPFKNSDEFLKILKF
ncbi:MAG TPA: pitrilysin family protein [Candidatus Paceibacterota bacterium]|nr:pitrilysin family protein [Candidatus Paceibacterota bacterium]